jgi:deoxyribodipyrimidine photo-lyase
MGIVLRQIPGRRIVARNDAPVDGRGQFVLYWMIACRRTGWNFALQRAADWARDLRKPLVVLETLPCGCRWASDRCHRFVMDGMVENGRRLAGKPVLYYPYVEPRPGAGEGLVSALAARACLVVTDDCPVSMLAHTVSAAVERFPTRLEQVDSNGLLPLRAADRVFDRAYSFRRFLQRELPEHLVAFPDPDPLAAADLPAPTPFAEEITGHWPAAPLDLLECGGDALATIPIDHGVRPVETRGGSLAAEETLRRFLDTRLGSYEEDRRHPDDDSTSGLSPYLHFGHISSHQVFAGLMGRERWSEQRLSPSASGSRSGWWGMSGAAEAFLDQLVTWRELGFNMCWQREDYDRYESLPAWALDTLAKHSGDPRPFLYSPDEFEGAKTHDPVWNAAQTQLVREGRVHNYMRMLWGKKILEWSASPQDALATMIELNNKYALDGRDPNSYSGIFWVLGRYDRPWGPERPVYGTVRYMSSQSTLRKTRAREYVRRYSP